MTTPRYVALYGVLSVVLCAPLFASPEALGGRDWDVHLFYHASVIVSLMEYGQLPFWNPWYCGGNVLWQNPQVALLSPVYPLSTIVSLALAMKVTILLHTWLGLVGAHLLIRRAIGLTFAPLVILLAVVATAPGAQGLHLAVGHAPFLAFAYLPWLLYFTVRALQSSAARYALAAGAALALMVLNGGVHVVPQAVIAVGLLGIGAAMGLRRLRPLGLAILVGVASLAYAAPKLLPVAAFVTSDRYWDTRPRMDEADYEPLRLLARAYVDPDQHPDSRYEGQRQSWHEIGNYIGPLAAGAIVLALLCAPFLAGADGRWLGVSLALATLVFLGLSAGEAHPWAPASLLARVPGFSSFRIPSRFTIGAVLLGAATVSWTARVLLTRWAIGPLVRVVATVLCAWAAIDIITQSRRHFEGAFADPPLFAPFQWGNGPRTLAVGRQSDAYGPASPMLRSLMNGEMFWNCYEPLQLRRSATPDDALVVASGEPPGALPADFTPNRVELTLPTGASASRLVLNQNIASGWHSNAGSIDTSATAAVLAVDVSPSHRGPVTFVFVPPGLVEGIATLLVGLVATVWMWRRA